MSSAQEQIDVFLHSEPCVTSSWLAHTLRISARTAADALRTYKSKAGAEVHAKHLVTRRDAHGNYSLTVIDEEHLDSLLEDKTQSVLSCAIYSLEKTHSAATPAQMVSSSFELVEALLSSSSSSSSSSSAEVFLSNSAGEISLKGLTVKPIGERLLSRCNTAASVNNSTAHHNSTAAAAAAAAAAPSSIASLAKDPPKVVSVEKAASFFRKAATTTHTNSTTTTKTTSSAESNNAPSGTTTSVTEEALIGSQTSTQSESKYEPLQTKSGAEKDKKAKKAKLSKKSTKDDEDEEWDDGEPVVAKKKRGIAEKNLTDEEKEDEENSAEAVEESKPAKKSKTAKPVNVNVRGAMDDYMEDAAIEQAKAQAEQPQLEEGKKKKTKKVLVEKTFTDEKGYFVTETVWEEVTDNEADNVSAVKPQPKAAPVEEKKEEKKATATAGKGKKTDAKPSGGVQKSMMSFFAKKT